MGKLTKTPFKQMGPWIREELEKGEGWKAHSNASLLRLLNRQYREIESLKRQLKEVEDDPIGYVLANGDGEDCLCCAFVHVSNRTPALKGENNEGSK